MAAFEIEDWPDEDCISKAFNSASFFTLKEVTCEELNS